MVFGWSLKIRKVSKFSKKECKERKYGKNIVNFVPLSWKVVFFLKSFIYFLFVDFALYDFGTIKPFGNDKTKVKNDTIN